MTITIQDVDKGRGNIIRGWGNLTGKEVVEAYTKHANQGTEKFGRYKYSLVDYTDVANLYISSLEIQKINTLVRAWSRLINR